ncbi:MAG: hypothetical protein SFY32_06865 [Bacteroidota bacterium]|nr:hypothetical protein [Bacteroidota bacterium]
MDNYLIKLLQYLNNSFGQGTYCSLENLYQELQVEENNENLINVIEEALENNFITIATNTEEYLQPIISSDFDALGRMYLRSRNAVLIKTYKLTVTGRNFLKNELL